MVDIVQEGIDLAVRGSPLEDSDLKATLLTRMQTLICASPAYLKTHGRPQSPEDLASHQWVYYQILPRHLVLTKGKRQYSIQMKGPVSTNNAAVRTAFVEAGEGLGRIPEYDARPGINQGTLEVLLPEYKSPVIDCYGVFSPGATSSVKVRLLIEFLKTNFQKINEQKL
jgi:DNA-binding transcriptional LysR family regulator